MAKHFTKEQVTESIKGSGGIVSAIAAKLGCRWNTARKYIDKWECTKQAYKDECEKVLDLAETKLMESMNEGDGPMIRFYLKTKGRYRGYVEKSELEVEGKKVSINIDLSSLTDTQLERIASGEDPLSVISDTRTSEDATP